MHRSCTRCGERKTLEEFYAMKHGQYGVMPWCKECFKAHIRKSYSFDPDLTKERVYAWRKKKKEEAARAKLEAEATAKLNELQLIDSQPLSE